MKLFTSSWQKENLCWGIINVFAGVEKYPYNDVIFKDQVLG